MIKIKLRKIFHFNKDMNTNYKTYETKFQVVNIDYINLPKDKRNKYFIDLILGGYLPIDALKTETIEYWYNYYDNYRLKYIKERFSMEGDFLKDQVNFGNVYECALYKENLNNPNTEKLNNRYWLYNGLCDCNPEEGWTCKNCKKLYYKKKIIDKLSQEKTCRLYYRKRNIKDHYIQDMIKEGYITKDMLLLNTNSESLLKETLTKIPI